MAPMETQVREHHMQLKRRLESVQRIHAATETLDERIRELAVSAGSASRQIEDLAALNQRVLEALSRTIQSESPAAQRA
jgi:prefoldin subunit 5